MLRVLLLKLVWYHVWQVRTQVNCSGTGSGNGVGPEGPFTLRNLDQLGIQPGWNCSISACFYDDLEDKYSRSPTTSCNLPGA